MSQSWTMNAVSRVLVLALAGCGSADVAGSPAGSDAAGGTAGDMTVVVTSDQSATRPAGLPISHAAVLIDRGGTIERTTTNDAGVAQFASAGVVAYHVVYKSETGWRIYTVALLQALTMELGSRSLAVFDHAMTLSVPPGVTNDKFTVHLSDQCGFVPESGTPTLTFNFMPACEGKPVHMVAFRLRSGGNEYIDAGNVTLANGATYAISGSYAPVPARTIELSNLPVGTGEVQPQILDRNGVEFTRLSPVYASATPQGSSATVMTTAVPGGNTLSILAISFLPSSPYSSTSEYIAPATITSTTRLDASAMLPLFTSLKVDSLSSLSWTGGGTGGTLIAVKATSDAFQWDAYIASSATAVTLPTLPADVGVPMPQVFSAVVVTKLDVPGATVADLARTLDRTVGQSLANPGRFPLEGGTVTSISYTNLFGPVITAAPAGAGGSLRRIRSGLPHRR